VVSQHGLRDWISTGDHRSEPKDLNLHDRGICNILGPVTATALLAVISDAKHFDNGQQLRGSRTLQVEQSALERKTTIDCLGDHDVMASLVDRVGKARECTRITE